MTAITTACGRLQSPYPHVEGAGLSGGLGTAGACKAALGRLASSQLHFRFLSHVGPEAQVACLQQAGNTTSAHPRSRYQHQSHGIDSARSPGNLHMCMPG